MRIVASHARKLEQDAPTRLGCSSTPGSRDPITTCVQHTTSGQHRLVNWTRPEEEEEEDHYPRDHGPYPRDRTTIHFYYPILAVWPACPCEQVMDTIPNNLKDRVGGRERTHVGQLKTPQQSHSLSPLHEPLHWRAKRDPKA